MSYLQIVLLLFPITLILLFCIVLIYINQKARHKKQLSDLKKSSELYNLYTRMAPLGFFEADINGSFINVNKKWTKLTGYTKEESLGKNWINTIFYPDREKVIKEWENSIKEKREFSIEFRFQHKESHQVWVYVNANGVLDKNKNITGYFGFVTDISNVKETQMKLAESEKKYRNLIDEASDVIYTVDHLGNFIFINNQAEKLTEYSKDELTGKNFTFLIAPYSLKPTIEFYKNQFEGRIKETVYDFEIITKTGKKRTVEQTVKMIQKDGWITGFECIVRDITKRKEATIYNIIESMSDGFVALDSNWKYVYINQTACDLFNKTQKDLIGKNIWEVFPEGIDQPFYKNYHRSMNEKIFIQFEDHYAPWNRWFENRVYPQQNGIAIYFKEITEQKETERKLEISRDRLELIYNSTKDIIFLIDVNEQRSFCFSKVNKAFLEATGLPSEKIENHLVEEVIPSSSLPLVLEKYNAAIDSGKTITWEETSDYPSGRKTGVVRIAPVFNELNICVNLIGTVHDITDRKNSEEELLKSREKYFSLINTIDGIVWEADTLDFKFTFVSNQAARITGFSIDAWLTDHLFWKKFVYEEDRDDVANVMKESSKTKDNFNHEFRVVTADKRIIWIRNYISCRFDENHVLKLQGIMLDITGNKEAENKLIQMNQQAAEYKLMALKSVMNPHFIFNSLNSIQYFVANNDRKNAINYLSVFASLIRKILSSSINFTIPLRTEIELLNDYLKLEKLRFENRFEYILSIDPEVDIDSIDIPSLLIQPYVENAILHGLMNKKDQGLLTISFRQQTEDELLIVVEDNGIGRQQAALIKSKSAMKQKSYGMLVTSQRLEIINKNTTVSVVIEDLKNNNGVAIGTRVNIKIHI